MISSVIINRPCASISAASRGNVSGLMACWTTGM
jgi:hypothetical protein